MDLQTIEDMVDHNVLVSIEEFAGLVDQVSSNASAYNIDVDADPA
jgi:hypothetical protein